MAKDKIRLHAVWLANYDPQTLYPRPYSHYSSKAARLSGFCVEGTPLAVLHLIQVMAKLGPQIDKLIWPLTHDLKTVSVIQGV